MTAFQRLTDRRPDLDIRLNVVGAVAPDVAFSASHLAKRSKGKIVLHGHLPDDRLEALRAASHANVFVSLAEGYGLPVAESVWGGKPCLCSNDGSIAEIAAGGGCLPVDPRDLDAIEAGFETLAANTARYDELLQEIARRPMRSWRDYASEVAARLVDFMEGRLQRKIPCMLGESALNGSEAGGASAAVLVLAVSDLRVPDAYGFDREQPIRHNGAIRYESSLHGAVNEDVLFFGPYIPLQAGRYAFAFDGEVDGELDLGFTADDGASKLARISVTRFAEPIHFELRKRVEKFEIVGRRTPSLKRLLLRGAFVEYNAAQDRSPEWTPRGPSSGTKKAAADIQAAVLKPAAEEPVYGRDDDGKPLRFPRTIPAGEMRVPDAYGVGDRNQLRTASTIAFRIKDHGRFDEKNIFFGPYFFLEPGEYAIRIDGELQGLLNLRITQKFASEILVDMTVKNFRDTNSSDADKPCGKARDHRRPLAQNAVNDAARDRDREDRHGERRDLKSSLHTLWPSLRIPETELARLVSRGARVAPKFDPRRSPAAQWDEMMSTTSIPGRQKFSTSFMTQMRVIFALMIREAQAKYSQELLGFFWTIAEPMILKPGSSFCGRSLVAAKVAGKLRSSAWL